MGSAGLRVSARRSDGLTLRQGKQRSRAFNPHQAAALSVRETLQAVLAGGLVNTVEPDCCVVPAEKPNMRRPATDRANVAGIARRRAHCGASISAQSASGTRCGCCATNIQPLAGDPCGGLCHGFGHRHAVESGRSGPREFVGVPSAARLVNARFTVIHGEVPKLPLVRAGSEAHR